MRKIGLTFIVLALALEGSAGFAFARGGGAQLLNSPGYQRRLQESRKDLTTDAAPVQRRTKTSKAKHKHHHQ